MLTVVQGHKRWEKSILTGYENVRRLTHEHILPAMERLVVLISRLRGLSRYQGSNSTLGLDSQRLSKVLDCASCMQLMAHHILRISSQELQEFQCFSSWLHQEIGIQSSETDPSDVLEKTASLDYPRILQYVQGACKQSKLLELLNLSSTATESNDLDLNAEGRSLFDLYRSTIKSSSEPDSAAWKNLPGLESLLKHLDRLCQDMFSQAAETQRRNVRMGQPIQLGKADATSIDSRMLQEVRTSLYHWPAFVNKLTSSYAARRRTLSINICCESPARSW